jgi:hypothetical protein
MWALQDLCLAAFFARYEPEVQCLLTSSAHKSPALSAFAYICADKYSTIATPMTRRTFDDTLLRALSNNDDRLVGLDLSDSRYRHMHLIGIGSSENMYGGFLT